MEQETRKLNASMRMKNKENKIVNEFQGNILQQKLTDTKVKTQSDMKLRNVINYFNKYFIDLILASFSLCVFMDLNLSLFTKKAIRELGQYPAILTSLGHNLYI